MLEFKRKRTDLIFYEGRKYLRRDRIDSLAQISHYVRRDPPHLNSNYSDC